MTPTLWITGAAGFSGGHLIRYLAGQADRPRVVGIDRAEMDGFGLDACHRLDLLQTEDVAALAREEPPGLVIHLAGATPPAPEAHLWCTNVGGTVSLMQGLAAAGCRGIRLLSVGSAAEYARWSDEPMTEQGPCGGTSPYGRAKWAQTLLALQLGRELGLSAMVVRPFNLIGPGLSTNLVASWLVEQYARPDVREITIGNLDSARDFVDIRDAVAACWLVAVKGKPGEVYNVCTGVPASVRQMLEMLTGLTGRSPAIRIDPARVRASDPRVCHGSYAKLRQATGWEPFLTLRDSLAAMLAGPVGAIPAP